MANVIMCPNPQKGIDDVLAQEINDIFGLEDSDPRKFTPIRVAYLRARYDVAHVHELMEENLDLNDEETRNDLANDLLDFLEEEEKSRAENLSTVKLNLADLYIDLNKSYPDAEERWDAINRVAWLFSSRVDTLSERNPNLDRKQIVNGVESVGGQTKIFEAVYKRIESDYLEETSKENPNTARAEALRKMLDNWTALTVFTRIRLRDTEGLILGAKNNYTADAETESWYNEGLEMLYNHEESTLEHWQEVSNAISSFGSVGKDVRRFLGQMPIYTKNERGIITTVKDSIYPNMSKMQNPVKLYNNLLETVRGCSSKQRFFEKLIEAEGNGVINFIGILRNLSVPMGAEYWRLSKEERKKIMLSSNSNAIDQLRTKLYVALRKNFQPYSAITESFKKGFKSINTIILNRTSKKDLVNKYLTKIMDEKEFLPEESIFGNDGKINVENFDTLKELINSKFSERVIENKPTSPEFSNISSKQKAYIISNIYSSIGAPITFDGAYKIALSRDASDRFIKYVQNLGAQINSLYNTSKIKNGVISIELLNYKVKGEVSLSDKMEDLLVLNSDYSGNNKFEKACRYKGGRDRGVTFFSDVTPSYLGGEIERIQEYVNNNDKLGLRKYIQDKYLTSPFYADLSSHPPRIYNWWLRELYNDSLNIEEPFKAESFAIAFNGANRLLGNENKNFEDFTSKEHIEALFSKYWAERQIQSASKDSWRRDYAEYPVFILGDSGVAKFIKAKRYDCFNDKGIERLLNGFYDVYVQETQRWMMTEAVAKKMNPHAIEEGGKLNWSKVTNKIKNFTDNYGKYTYLPFLNKNYKDINGKINNKYSKLLSDNPSKEEVKNAIRLYIEDSLNDFKKNLAEKGVIKENIVDGKISYTADEVVNQEVNNSKLSVEELIQDFFWNQKFAMIQQLQIFTVDPAYYKDSKDLQKRYKEIHAPGTVLDVTATWNGELVAGENAIEKCVYFKDIEVNGETIDSTFMSSILKNYAMNNLDKVDEAIKQGITVPKDNEQEEASRISKLKEFLGNNWWIYDNYKKNSVTDGQGYRSLSSYRKVMIMAGKWDINMENTYNRIREIQKGNLTEKDIRELASLATVFMPLKPYMYTLENYSVNNKEKILIPVQHKYSEAVLIPELLPKDSKLRHLAERMESEEFPIDVVCATTVVKVGEFGAVDLTNVSDEESINNVINNAYVHQLSYSDYRIQTNVPEHINSSQLFGTQIRKLIMAGIDMSEKKYYDSYTKGNIPRLYQNKDSDIKKMTGANIVRFFNALITANILDSYNTFRSNIKSEDKVSDLLLQATISNSRESVNNLLAYALADDGDFEFPLFEGGLEHDSSNLLLSLFKKTVNKQKINGGSLVQASCMGISGKENDGNLHYIKDPNHPGNYLAAECEVPFDFSYTDQDGKVIELDYNDWVNPDGTIKKDSKGNTLIEKKFPGILDMIAYRIPTERDYSMLNLKIVRFSHKESGGTIKVPAPETTKAGFDFDIDKLFFMRRQYKVKGYEFTSNDWGKIYDKIYEKHRDIEEALKILRERDENNIIKDGKKKYAHHLNWYFKELPSLELDENYNERALIQEAQEELLLEGELNYNEDYLDSYNYNKLPLDNTRVARNNMLIDLIQQRLQDPETFENRNTPGGFRNAKIAAKEMRELFFSEAEGLINSDGTVNFTELYKRTNSKEDPEPNYDPSDPWTMVVYNQQNQVAGKLIGIFANQNTNFALASLMSKLEITKGNEFGFCGHNYSDFLKGPENVNVGLNVAEFLAASVDAVKDPVLNFLNLNTITADAGVMLARLGYTTEEIGLLFNQPIIKQACEKAFNENTKIEYALKSIINEYSKEAKEIAEDNNSIKDFSKNRLALSIINDRTGKKGGLQEEVQQIEVAELFSSILKVSSELSEFVTNTKFTASNAAGSTFGDYYAQQMKVESYVKNLNMEKDRVLDIKVSNWVNSPIELNKDNLKKTDKDYMESIINHPFAYEQAMFDTHLRLVNDLKRYYPYETPLYNKMRNILKNLSWYENLDAATINSLHSDFLVYLLSHQEASPFNPDGVRTIYDKNDKLKNVTNREYYLKYFPNDILQFTNNHPQYLTSPVFKYMDRIYNQETGEYSLDIQNIGGLQPYEKDELRESWASLLNDPEGKDIATGMFLYCFYKLGFTFSPKSFMNLTPIEVKQAITWSDFSGETSYKDFLLDLITPERGFNESDASFKSRKGTSGKIKETSSLLADFALQYILNHTDNSRFVYFPKGKRYDKYQKLAKLNTLGEEQSSMQSSFIVDVTGNEDYSDIIKKTENSDTITFRPVIALTESFGNTTVTHYYIAQSESSLKDDDFNKSTDGRMKYVRFSERGKSNVSLNYSSNNIWKSNNKASENPPVQTPVDQSKFEDLDDMSYAEILRHIVDATGEELEKRGSSFDRAAFTRELSAIKEANNISSIKALALKMKANYENNKETYVYDDEGNPILVCF